MAAKKKRTAKRPAAKKPAARRPVARKPAAKKPAAKRPVRRKAAPQPRPVTALQLAGVGSEAVMRATGRAWEEWLKLLDRLGAKAMPHRDIARLLHSKFEVPAWWSQMVAVGYEQARGLRQVHQNAMGFSANASRTINANLDALYAAWSEPLKRAQWLPAAPIEIRRSTDGKSLRITWTLGPSNVDVGFFAKGPQKSTVQVEHSKLEDEAAAALQKDYWSEALLRLKALLEPK